MIFKSVIVITRILYILRHNFHQQQVTTYCLHKSVSFVYPFTLSMYTAVIFTVFTISFVRFIGYLYSRISLLFQFKGFKEANRFSPPTGSTQSPLFNLKFYYRGRDPFNQNSNRSDREKSSTSKGGPVFSKLFRFDRTDPLSFGPKFPEILVEWIAPRVKLVARFRFA